MERRGYDGYRGRTRAQTVVRAVVCVVVLLLVLVIVGLLLGQRYIVYTDDGIRLEVPFLQRETATSADVGDVSVQIIHRPNTTPGPSAAAEPYNMRAGSVTMEELEATGIPAVRAMGANTVIVDMKKPDGTLGYADAARDRVSACLEQLHRADIRAVARISCFRDDTLGRQDDYALRTNSGYRWNYDDVGLYWINPGLEPVRQYVADVVATAAQLGFDEVLLENWGYPAQGEVGWIRRGEGYDPERLHEAVDRFVSLAQQAVTGTETVVSLLVDASVLDASDTLSGRTLDCLEGHDGRVWLQNGQGTTLEDLVSRTLLKPEQVVWPAQAYTEGNRHQYLVP